MSPLKVQHQGKFWPEVRALIWEKAQELYQQEQFRCLGHDFKGITATKAELREGGYFYQAKIIVLRELWHSKKGLPTFEEEEASEKLSQGFFQNK